MAAISKIKNKSSGEVFDIADALARNALKDGTGGKVITVNTFNNLPTTKEQGKVDGQLAWVLSDRIASEPDERGYVTYTYTGYKAGLYAYNEAKETWLQISKNEYVQLYFVKKDEDGDYVVTKMMNVPVNFGRYQTTNRYQGNFGRDKEYNYDRSLYETLRDIDNSYANMTDKYLFDIGIHDPNGYSDPYSDKNRVTEVLVPIASYGSAKSFDFDSLKVGSKIHNDNFIEAPYGSYIYDGELYYLSEYHSNSSYSQSYCYKNDRTSETIVYKLIEQPYNGSIPSDRSCDFVSFSGNRTQDYSRSFLTLKNGQLCRISTRASGEVIETKKMPIEDLSNFKYHHFLEREDLSSELESSWTYIPLDTDKPITESEYVTITTDSYGRLIVDYDDSQGIVYINDSGNYFSVVNNSYIKLSYEKGFIDGYITDYNGYLHKIYDDGQPYFIIDGTNCGLLPYGYTKFFVDGEEVNPLISYDGMHFDLESGTKVYLSSEGARDDDHLLKLSENAHLLPSYGRATVHTSLILEDTCMFAGNQC